MLRTLIVLPDGTKLSSGVTSPNAIQTISITECVNGAQELALGSCCANMVEARIITPEGGLSLSAGEDIEVFRVDEDGTEYKVGIFTTEKPTRPTANSMSITAYDRVSWLDKDLTLWLESLDQWPYTLISFAHAVCNACDLELLEPEENELPNSAHLVQRFSADGITGRKLMQWVGEICGRFCRATPDGKIEFAWYTPAEVEIGCNQVRSAEVAYRDGNLSIRFDNTQNETVDGAVDLGSEYLHVSDNGEGDVVLKVDEIILQDYYFQNGLSFENYTTAQIEKIQLRQNDDDVGTVWPDTAEKMNTYAITGNYLLSARNGQDLVPVAQVLHEHLSNIEPYTPCRVSIPTNPRIRAGNIVKITDRNGKTITAYVMTKRQTGQRDMLECTGSASLDSSTAVNNQTFRAFVGKVLNLQTDVDGIRASHQIMDGRVAALELTADGIAAQVERQEQEGDELKQAVSRLSLEADTIKATVTSVVEDGVGRVHNEFGLTIDGSSIRIQRSGRDMTNRLDEMGMEVVRGHGATESVMLRADAQGVLATDVTVRNYLRVGSHARFEDYGSRTACYYTKGDTGWQ